MMGDLLPFKNLSHSTAKPEETPQKGTKTQNVYRKAVVPFVPFCRLH
jgi:hypothetical protein